MQKSLGHISNPLTVIGIFAALTETIGAITLPFLEPSSQFVFVWFIMAFPTLLIILFFLTLNFNAKVLYAPSDFKDEQNYLKINVASPKEEREKLRMEAAESQKGLESPEREPELEEPTEENNRSNSTNNKPPPTKKEAEFTNFMAKYALAERLAINRLSAELGITFKRNAKLSRSNGESIVFDAYGESKYEIHVVEVKLLRGHRVPIHMLSQLKRHLEGLLGAESEIGRKRLVLHLVIVTDGDDYEKSGVAEILNEKFCDFRDRLTLHIFTLKELEIA